MGSANFQAYDKTLRRMFMMRLVERLEAERGGNFRASLVVDARSGFQKLPRTGEFSRRNGMKNADAA